MKRKAAPPLCTLFYAIALPPIEAALLYSEIARRSALQESVEKASSRGAKYERERQLNDGETYRRNYAIADVCIRHSHSIISRSHNALKFRVKKIFVVRYTVTQSVKNSRY